MSLCLAPFLFKGPIPLAEFAVPFTSTFSHNRKGTMEK
jgi:hypothetical protein